MPKGVFPEPNRASAPPDITINMFANHKSSNQCGNSTTTLIHVGLWPRMLADPSSLASQHRAIFFWGGMGNMCTHVCRPLWSGGLMGGGALVAMGAIAN